MRERMIKNQDGEVLSLCYDGRTVWVNTDVHLIGRFSAKGIDVHAPLGSDKPCLDCRRGSEPWGEPSRAEWEAFAASMLKHHRVVLPKPDGLVRLRS